MTKTVRHDITKEEVARREIEAAIRMYFSEEDAIAVHIVASAAYRVLTDICKRKKIRSGHDEIMDRIVPDKKKEARRLMTAAYDYFRHADGKFADRDPDLVLPHFDEEGDGVFIFICCDTYRRCYGKMTTTMSAYVAWFLVGHPDMVLADHPLLPALAGKAAEDFRRLSLSEQKELGSALLKAQKGAAA
jgi:hypothetical protein